MRTRTCAAIYFPCGNRKSDTIKSRKISNKCCFLISASRKKSCMELKIVFEKNSNFCQFLPSPNFIGDGSYFRRFPYSYYSYYSTSFSPKIFFCLILIKFTDKVGSDPKFINYLRMTHFMRVRSSYALKGQRSIILKQELFVQFFEYFNEILCTDRVL